MARAFTTLALLCLLALSVSAQFRQTRFDPETDPRAFDITTRADLEDSLRRVASLRAQLADARVPRDRENILDAILRQCQEELNKTANSSGAVVVEKSSDPRTPGMAVRWRGAFQVIEEAIRELGPEGLKRYEQLYGARARSLLQAAVAASDTETITGINRRFGLTAAGSEAAGLLASMHWERGEFSAAARALERALWAEELISPARRAGYMAWLSACYRELGERANLSRLSASAAALGEAQVDAGGRQVALASLLAADLVAARDTTRDVLDSQGVEWPGGNYTNTGLHPAPADYSQVAWARALPPLAAPAQYPFMNYPAPVVTPFMPVYDGDLVYVNIGDQLVAYEAAGGGADDTPLWGCRPFPVTFTRERARGQLTTPHWRTSEPDPAMTLPVSVWNGTVYTALENPLHSNYHDKNPEPMFNLHSHYPHARRALCAVEGATGRLLWKIGGLYEGGAHDTTSFHSAVVYDGVLYAIGARVPGISEIFLYALEPVTGEILWHLRLCYGQQETTMFGRPARAPFASLPAIAGGNLYLCTNLGGVVAVDLGRRSLRWISRYEYIPRPQTKYVQTFYRDVTWYNNPTLYADHEGKSWVVVAPADSDTLFGLDAASGEIRWRAHRDGLLNGGRALVGLRDGVVYVAGDGGPTGPAASRLVGVSLGAGRRLFDIRPTAPGRNDTLALVGRPSIAGNRVYWPGRSDRQAAIAEIDLDARRSTGGAAAPPAYGSWGFSVFTQRGLLYTISGANYSAGNSQLAARYDPAAMLNALRAQAADAGNLEARLRLGLLLLRQGDRAGALAHLRAAFDGASMEPVNTRVREHASRALVNAALADADLAIAGRRFADALRELETARRFALARAHHAGVFLRQEMILTAQSDQHGLAALFERVLKDDPDFGVGQDPELPARLYAAIRLAGLVETGDPQRAAALYQQVQDSPERYSWQGVRLRALALDKLKALIRAHGRAVYAAQDAEARALLESGTVEGWQGILRRYPLAVAADDAALKLTEDLLVRRDPAGAAVVLLQSLEENADRPRKAQMQALLALCHHRAGERLRARLVALRTLRDYPDDSLELEGRRRTFKELLTPLTGDNAATVTRGEARLPAQPVELWRRNWEPGGYTYVPEHPPTSLNPRAYLAERGPEGFSMVCLDAPSGEPVWRRELNVSLQAVHELEDGVLLQTHQGFMKMTDSGDERWSVPAGAVRAMALERGMLVYARSFVDSGTRLPMCAVHALDVDSGGELWAVQFQATQAPWLAIGPQGVMAMVEGNESLLLLLNAETGATLKQARLDLPGRVSRGAALSAGMIWLADNLGNLRGIRAQDLEPRVSVATGQRSISMLRAEGERVVVAGLEGAACVDAAGNRVWGFSLERGMMLRAAHYAGSMLYLAVRDPAGGSRLIGINPADGSVAFRAEAPRNAETDRMEHSSSMAFDGGFVLSHAVYGMSEGMMRLTEFRIVVWNADGTERAVWSHAISAGSPMSHMAITEGHLIVTCGDATLCFGSKG